jgi:hypothetical protein
MTPPKPAPSRSATPFATRSSSAGCRRAQSCRKAMSAISSTSAARWRAPPCRRCPMKDLSASRRIAAPSSPTPRPMKPGRSSPPAAWSNPASCAKPPPGSRRSEIQHLKQLLLEEGRLMGERGQTARRAEIKASGDFHLMLAVDLGQCDHAALHGRAGCALVAGDRALRPVDRLELRPLRTRRYRRCDRSARISTGRAI